MVKDSLKNILIPEGRRRYLQLLSPPIIAAGSLLVESSPGLYGLPLGFYSPGTVTCQALNCPPSQAAGFRAGLLVADLLFWYIVTGILFAAYRRWNE